MPTTAPLGAPRADTADVRALLDQMLDGCAVYVPVRGGGRPDGPVVDFERTHLNPAGIRLLAGRGIDVRVRSMVEANPGIERHPIFGRYVEVVERQQPWSGRDVAYRDDRVSGIYDVQAWPVGPGFAVTWREVTDRERVLDALRESEQRFRATVDQLPDAVSVFESVRDESGAVVDFRWVYCNAYNAEMTGYTVEDLVGRRLLEVFPEQGPAGMIDVYAEVVATGESWQQPTVWYEDHWGDGTRRRRAFDVRASKVGDGFVVVSRDVTELRTTASSLEESSQALRDLLGLVGHDLRNPLAVSLGYLDLAILELTGLAASEADTSGVEGALHRARDAALRVDSLLGDVLALSRLDHASLDSAGSRLDLAEVVQTSLAETPVRSEVVVGDLAGTHVLADDSYLRQVLGNLLSNADKYGGSPIHLEVEPPPESAGSQGSTRLVVTDHGPGVPPDFVPRLFDRFSRAEGVVGPGSGLGLHLSRQLCRAMGGDLVHEPGPRGRGSRFVVILPTG